MARSVPAILTTVAIALATVSVSTAPAATSATTTQEQEATMLPPLHEPSPSTGIPFSTPDLPPGVLRYDPAAVIVEPELPVYSAPPPVTRDELVTETTGGPLGSDVDAALEEVPAPSDDDVASAVTHVIAEAARAAGLPGIVSTSYDDATTVITVPDEATAAQAQALAAGLPARILIDPAQAAVDAVFAALFETAGAPIGDMGYGVRAEDIIVADDFTWPGHVIVSYKGPSGEFTQRQWDTVTRLGALYPGVLFITSDMSIEPRACSNTAANADGLSFTRCDNPGLAGSQIKSADGASCTMGPRLYGDSGRAYVATAGHCIAYGPWSPAPFTQAAGSDWDYGRSPAFLGYSTRNYLDGSDGRPYARDVQLIEIDPEMIAGSVVKRSSTTSFAAPQPLTSIAPIEVNDPRCYAGMNFTSTSTGLKCGKITRRDLPIFLYGSSHVGGSNEDPITGLTYHAIEVTVTDINGSASGDSGSPFFNGSKLQGVLSSDFVFTTSSRTMFTEISDESFSSLQTDYYDRTRIRFAAVSNSSNRNVLALNGGSFGYGKLWWGFPDDGGGATSVKQIRLPNGNHRFDIVWNAALSTYSATKSGTARLTLGCARSAGGVMEWREMGSLDMATSAPMTSHIISNRQDSFEMTGPACETLQMRYTATILRTRTGGPPYVDTPLGSPQTWVSDDSNLTSDRTIKGFYPVYS